jgi:hypothetical protein
MHDFNLKFKRHFKFKNYQIGLLCLNVVLEKKMLASKALESDTYGLLESIIHLGNLLYYLLEFVNFYISFPF